MITIKELALTLDLTPQCIRVKLKSNPEIWKLVDRQHHPDSPSTRKILVIWDRDYEKVMTFLQTREKFIGKDYVYFANKFNTTKGNVSRLINNNFEIKNLFEIRKQIKVLKHDRFEPTVIEYLKNKKCGIKHYTYNYTINNRQYSWTEDAKMCNNLKGDCTKCIINIPNCQMKKIVKNLKSKK